MTSIIILCAVVLYFALLMAVSRLTGAKADNEAFYRAGRKAPWPAVAFGMVGASISGITFVSVPGMVMRTQMTYLQTCLGFILGYVVVALLLLPLYYRLNLTSIYGYLGQRLGRRSHLTGSTFFLLSKMAGASVRFYVVCMILQRFVFDAFHVPLPLTVVLLVALIWLYTRRGGMKTLVWTDTMQTVFLFTALLLIIYSVTQRLDMTAADAVAAVWRSDMSRVFVWGDWVSTQNFWKQFVSGMFIVVVMTGLDQDMMQKNLTCRTKREAQKDMLSYGVAFVPVNALFLTLGALLVMLSQRQGVALPSAGDSILPEFVAQAGTVVEVLFVLGIVAASFSSADSALTSLTTIFCVDLMPAADNTASRRRVHVAMCAVFVVVILLVHAAGSKSLIDAIYTIVGYTYGPLLGLFAFGLLTHCQTSEKWVPYIAVFSPLACYAASLAAEKYYGYRFGYELLLMNGLLTFIMLFCCRKRA